MNNQNIIFIDIETVPQKALYDELDERTQSHWNKKASFISNVSTSDPQQVYERAGIYAEFGKIVSIALGRLTMKGESQILRIQDFSGHHEKQLLLDFKNAITKRLNHKNTQLCAHNGKEFDFPYLARRMIINGIELPEILNLSGKKPWEIQHIDTMEMWKFGDFKNFTSLDLLSAVLNITSSKVDIDGSDVYGVYYHEKDLQRIARYCKRDVAVLVQVYLRLKGEALLPEENIIFMK